MLHTLRIRLIVGFGLVILLSIVLAGAGSMLLLREQQAEAAEERIGRLVEPLSQWVLRMELVGTPRERIAGELAAYAAFEGVRILLLDESERVVVDTQRGSRLIGRQLPGTLAVPTAPASGNPAEMTSFRTVHFDDGGEELYLFSASPGGLVPAGWPFQVPQVSLVVAVPAGDVTDAWAVLLPRLLVAGGIATLFGVAIAYFLAGRVTRPLRQMTLAAEAITHGDYDQRVEEGGGGEVAALGRAFNQMAQQVARSNRAMRQLIANISHDLKTPLTSIQGYSQAIVDGMAADEEETSRLAEVVHEEAERMRILVDDLLYLSRIESGELRLAVEDFDLDAVIEAAVRRFRYQAEGAHVTFDLALGAGPVEADEHRIEQVLTNLVDNAIRFAPPGTAIEIRSAREPAAVTLSVHNGGPPIPAEDLPYVFDRFYQVDRARTRADGGGHSGLGLAIVSELVAAHGGAVTVQSATGRGTTFTVSLPRHAAGPGQLRWAPADQPGNNERGATHTDASMRPGTAPTGRPRPSV